MLPEGSFSAFEIAVLQSIRDKYRDQALSAQIDASIFKSRKWTEVGYYIYFDVPHSIPAVSIKNENGHSWPIHGPLLPPSSEIEHGGMTLLWGKDGYTDTLEMWAHGEHFAKDPNLCDLSKYWADRPKIKDV